MRAFLIACSIIITAGMVFQKRFKILNALLAVNTLRKLAVTVSMNIPYIRTKIMPAILGRSAS
ncbi:hypothetical protein [Sediminibacillus halophilus]|uniref:Uncharacterized protein n=1 Tax=Sediminibacillus halophilus TaxID=482461 RepID=A0A1G9YFZ9_9BACI|nr:hypothetical protein [Sediminibacillus halophilus]SDN07937.1 hypothetical protein SAMN05216244_4148 [Sediminibacillus halophilus]